VAPKDTRNEIAHYVGAMAPDIALRHRLNIRQLLKDLAHSYQARTTLLA